MHLDLLNFSWFFVNICRGRLPRLLSRLTALEEHQPEEEDYDPDYIKELGDDLPVGATSHPTL